MIASVAIIFGLIVGEVPVNAQTAPSPVVVETNPTKAAEEGGVATRSYGSALWYAHAMVWRSDKSFGMVTEYVTVPKPCIPFVNACTEQVPVRYGLNIYRYARRLLNDVYVGGGRRIRPIQDLLWKAGSPPISSRCAKVSGVSWCLTAAQQRAFMHHWIYGDTDLDSTAATGIRESLIAAQRDYNCMSLTIITRSNWTNKNTGCYIGGIQLP